SDPSHRALAFRPWVDAAALPPLLSGHRTRLPAKCRRRATGPHDDDDDDDDDGGGDPWSGGNNGGDGLPPGVEYVQPFVEDAGSSPSSSGSSSSSSGGSGRSRSRSRSSRDVDGNNTIDSQYPTSPDKQNTSSLITKPQIS
ncbi:hypothetical protein F5X96DRAFT_671564, partial [Biscogniauxia mediterranea]